MSRPNGRSLRAPLWIGSILLLAACQRSPTVRFTVAPRLEEGRPPRFAVTLRLDRVPSGGLDLRGFTTADALRIGEASAEGPDGSAVPVTLTVENVGFNSRTLDIPHLSLRGPLPRSLVVRYTTEPGAREGDSHMGFTGRCHGALGPQGGFVVGRELFLLPEPADAVDDIEVAFDLPEGWQPLVPWKRPAADYRPGIDREYAAEHLVSAAIGLGHFRERDVPIGSTLLRLLFATGVSAEDEDRAAARIETAARYIHDLFGRDLGAQYLVIAMPRAATGDEIAGEGWATGQGQTLVPLTATRLHDFALSFIEAYVRHAPYRSEIRRPEEYWLVDGVKQLYAWRAVAKAGLVPDEAITRNLAEAYLVSAGVHGVEQNLEIIYDAPGAHRIESETRAPFVLEHLDRELRASGSSLDALVPELFGRRRAPSLWSTIPEIRPGFREEFRTRYVQGRATIPLGDTYALTKPAEKPDPPAGPVTRRLTVLFTGDTQGYLENCGCKVNQSGGVARRATALAGLRKADPEALLLDAGSTFVRPEKQLDLDFLTRQEQALYLSTLDTMRYQAAAIGTTELTYGLDYFREQVRPLSTPFLAGNIRIDGRSLAPASKILRAHGLDIGVLAVFEPPYGKEASSQFEENTRTLMFEDPIVFLRREAPALRQRGASLVLALGRLTPFTVRAAAAIPGLDGIISSDFRAPLREGDAPGHVHTQDEPGFVGRTLVAYSSLTNYGLSSVTLGLDASGRIAEAQFGEHWLHEDTPDDPRLRDTLNRFYDRIGRMAQAQQAVPALFTNDTERRDGRYVGAEKCAECHAAEMAQWRRTKHAAAYKTLLDRHRHFQPKCIVCHVVGYGTPHGYRLGMPEAGLGNVQCEVCHGPGAAHAADPSTKNIRRTVPAEVCLECHTPDHSDHFVYSERLPKVKHDYFEQ